MDNNQQFPTPKADVQPARGSNVNVEAEVAPQQYASVNVTNLGIEGPSKVAVPNQFTGSDVSMTTGQSYGGPIVSTEQTAVTRQAGPQ